MKEARVKELVQNAEDAGADTVKFLYDVRQFGTETLYLDSLAPYQGPSLYSFNNAKFKKADWDGIQTPARSNKKTDRLKVGRFGIGFNSVYHITDLPSIMSDQKLAFIDPLEEHFFDKRGRVKTGWQFGLRSDSDIFSKNEDQFQPYHNIFPGVTGGISAGYFDGTLFRFPLRHAANSLSDKIYSDEGTLSELLLAFRADADVAMLFLRSLNNIEVLERPSDLQEPSLVVRVRREHDPETHPPGKEFSSRLETYCSDVSGRRGPIKLIDCVTFTTETPEASKAQHWVVSHHIAGDSMSRELSDLAEKQSYLPWAAVAIPVSSSEPRSVTGEAENNNIGRVFCFLPLPPGEESRTGLPVHVHGFFAVNSDRRGIKWPGPDQTDTPAQWNQLLVRELIPIVYVDAIKYAISSHTSQDKVTADCIYRSWPDHEEVRGNWDILLEPFYYALFQETIIHSDNNGWMNIADVHFNELNVDEDMEKAILKCFNIKGIAYTRVPNVCRQAIKKFYKDQISTVSASSLCRCLREDPAILTKLNADEKLLILEFILREDARQDLEGLCLLPLDDGSVHFFSSSDEKKVYIPTTKFHRQLVPGGNHRFIRTVPEDKPLHQLLSNMDGRYQLKALTLDAVAELLKTSMKTRIDDQGTWVQDTDGPSLNTWLEKVWSMLYRESSSKLLLFEGIHLVPLFEADGEGRRLLPLCPKSGIIQRSHQSLTLTNDLANILQQIGVTVTNCPDYVLRHPAIMRDEYIKMPTSEGIVKCLLLSDVELLVQIFHSFSPIDRDVLVEYLAQAKLSHDGKKLLSCLPLFERVDGTGNSNKPLVSIEQCEGYIECCQDDIPAPLKLKGLLINGRIKSKCLLQKLEVCLLSKYQVIMNVLEEVHERQLYSKQEKQLVLQWIMEHWEDIKVNCKSSVDILRHMKFIPNKANSLLSPCELLDPRDPLLDELFASQGVFPGAPFDSPQVIEAFQQLGMRGPREVTSSELITCVEMVAESQSPEKARTLLELLTSNQSLLEKSVIDHMKQKQCIPCRQSPPEYYPLAIEWYGKRSTRLLTPHEILREKKLAVLTCGASKCFTSQEDESRFSTVYTKIGMNIPSPIISDVMTQFEDCVRYAEDRTGEDVTDIVPMLKEIYSCLMEAWRQDKNTKNLILNRAKVCIWNGSGFSEPSKMCAVKLPFHLAPYMASIPQSTIAFADLFEALGVEKNMAANSNALVDILHEIKKRCDDSKTDVAFQQGQRQLVLQILHHLHAGELPEEARARLLVPSQKGECHLIPVDESAYVDREWLRQSTDNEEMDDGEDFTLIHLDISMDLAIFLQVRPVSRLLLDTEESQGFTPAGQHEPLTMRLWNILKNNYVDTAIISEMIQNAEDAGAQEVRFLIDMRKNENANLKLFDPEMRSCQGPALWVYNDAVFTDQDFENILRLGGRTKEKDAEKIGKFGTGFNSVYLLTDVPSLVSRNYMQCFDPHTTHLGNVLRDKSQPGVRLRLNSTKALRRFPDQFKPFKGVFGLDFSRGNEPFNYNGTLFRLPLRSKEAAQKSQICKESYDGEKLINLMQKMWESSQNLLVFTKQVKKVSLFYLSENSSDPTRAEELLTIQKTMHYPRVKDDGTVVSTESFRCQLTSRGAELLPHINEIGNQEHTSSFNTFKVVCKTSKQASVVAQSQEGKSHGLSPEAAVAIPLNVRDLQKIEGEIYCGLPLSVPSLLPFHIDGRFAINEDRRSLQSPTTHGVTVFERWNHILLSDVICRAYVSLLSDKEFIQQIKNTYGTDVSPELFWPDVDKVPENSVCSGLFNAFYKTIICGLDGKQPAVFWTNDEPRQFHNVVFLGEELQTMKGIKDDFVQILTTYLKEYCHSGRMVEVIELSKKTWQALERAGVRDMVETRTYNLNRLFDEAFLPYLDKVPQDLRDRLILFALEMDGNLHQKLRDVKCITVSGGAELKTPCALMHHDDPTLRELFELQGVFPGAPFDSAHLMPVFNRLGMRGPNEVTPVEMVECVDLVEKTQCPKKARALFDLLGKNPGHFDRSLADGSTVRDFMMNKRCIPCKQSPPEYYPPDFEWRGNTPSCLTTPQEILIETKQAVLMSGASKSFISQQDVLFSTAFTLLGITCHTPVISDVIAQIEHCVKYATYRTEQDVTDIIPMLKEIYAFLRKEWQRDSNVRNYILDRVKCCVWNGNGFSEPSKMCTGNLPFDLAPYMASIPQATCAFKDLFEALGVKRNIDTNSEALVEIQHEIKSKCDVLGANVTFQQRQRQLVLQILHHLHATGELSKEARVRLLVPSQRGECHLIPVDESAYVDREWLRQSTDNEEMDDDDDFTLIHSDISMKLAIFLHVRPSVDFS
ncbi:sacsin-like [Strongylocentrotus purpuratus]|uniref:Sacsin/Nov domain-containing protein n=1 Tax=Strongylocentrotus purpuratus TaxID=7668 RepID=A0A7M7NS09_STRPU|nr:sacsin-like [Strongylocentrotus purpuratus]